MLLTAAVFFGFFFFFKRESTTKLLQLSRPILKAADVFIFSDTSGQVSFDIRGDGNSHSRAKKKWAGGKKSDEMLHKLRDVKSRCLFTLYL